MAQVTVGVLHPGEMGASVGAAARRGGAEVVWASQSRGASTHARAVADGLRDVGTLQNLVKVSDVIVSVCPPGAAAVRDADVGQRPAVAREPVLPALRYLVGVAVRGHRGDAERHGLSAPARLPSLQRHHVGGRRERG